MMDKKEVTEHIMKMKRSGDMILVLGAGDIKDVANELSERLGKR
jgi:UDP-N-acetylmuramate-alanine ligase